MNSKEGGYARIKMRGSKTDPAGFGCERIMSRENGEICVVKAVEYLKANAIRPNSLM